MKTKIHLYVLLVIFAGVSCKKEKKVDVEEKQATTVSDARDKYLGSYNCLVKSRRTDFANTLVIDSTYSKVIQVKKSEISNGLKITNAKGDTTIFEVIVDTEPNFSGARIHGYFYKGDSLYINNSHTSGIYSNIYYGKKIK